MDIKPFVQFHESIVTSSFPEVRKIKCAYEVPNVIHPYRSRVAGKTGVWEREVGS